MKLCADKTDEFSMINRFWTSYLLIGGDMRFWEIFYLFQSEVANFYRYPSVLGIQLKWSSHDASLSLLATILPLSLVSHPDHSDLDGVHCDCPPAKTTPASALAENVTLNGKHLRRQHT